MRKVLTFAALFVLVAAVFCGGDKTEAPKTETPTTQAPTLANLPAGWPAEAFSELTKAELDAYVKPLPNVAAALKTAKFKPVGSTPADLVKDLGLTIDAMKSVAGVEDALKAANVTWDAFRITTFKVLATNSAMAMGIAEAMVAELKGEEAEKAKAELQKAKAVFDQVPKKNSELVFSYMDQLAPLDKLGQEGE